MLKETTCLTRSAVFLPQEQRHPCLNGGFRMSDFFFNVKSKSKKKRKRKLAFLYEMPVLVDGREIGRQ